MKAIPSFCLQASVVASILSAWSVHADVRKKSAMQEDKKFLEAAVQSGQAEVALGQLAADKGSSSAVKDFGTMMKSDHGDANSKLAELAKMKGLTSLSEPSPAQKAAAGKLEKLTGNKFDKAYAQLMVKEHKKTVAAFKKESTATKDTDLKDYTTKTLPTLENHLQRANELEKSLPVK